MSLHVFTARISSRDPDRLDITRKAVDLARKKGEPEPLGAFLAPSWAILRPALEARRGLMYDEEGSFERFDVAWSTYIEAYLREMRRSLLLNRPAWNALLARPRVVLVCYCTDPEHCHRYLLRARILPALGAVDCGEIMEAAA